MDDEPLYVNARQYHRILKRRAARAREAEVRRLSTQRKVCPPHPRSTSLPLSLARFLSSVSLGHISGIRRHINNHLHLLLNSLTRSSFPLPTPLSSFLAFNTFLPF